MFGLQKRSLGIVLAIRTKRCTGSMDFGWDLVGGIKFQRFEGEDELGRGQEMGEESCFFFDYLLA